MHSFLPRRLCGRAAMISALFCFIAPGAAGADEKACIPISTVQQLQNIRNNLGGNYCLTRNIDARNFTGFKAIGDNEAPLTNPFHGTFDGRGRTISNLKIFKGLATVGYTAAEVGLFMTVGQKVVNGKLRVGVVKNLRLLNVDARWTSASSAWVGGLAGGLRGKAIINNVEVTGSVRGGDSTILGGIIGQKDGGTLSQCLANVAVNGADFVWAGGAVGRHTGGTIRQCGAKGPVTTGDGSDAGGFTAVNFNKNTKIIEAFSLGAVKTGDSSNAAGFTTLNQNALLQYVYSRSSVTVGAGFGVSLAALVTFSATASKIIEGYATGKVQTTATFPTNIGGLIAFAAPDDTLTEGYWDTESTGQTESDGGEGRTTAQLKAALPPGFNGAIWGRKPNQYPYLKKIPEN